MLGLFLVLVSGASAIAGAVTRPRLDVWYAALTKPALTPPDLVFPVVWTSLFVLMALAAWLVWRVRGFAGASGAFALWGTQLVLNVMWSVLFFGLMSPGLAFLEVTVFLVVVAATAAAFWRHRLLAGVLMVPYVLWVGFAAVLTAQVWLLN